MAPSQLRVFVLLGCLLDGHHCAGAGGVLGTVHVHGGANRRFGRSGLSESNGNQTQNGGYGTCGALHPASQVENPADMHVAGCTLRINSDLNKESPLLLKPSGSLDGNRFFLPTPESDVLHFRAKEKILLACPGTGNNLVVNRRQKPYKETSVSCDSGKKFKIDGTSTDCRNITCKDTPESSIVKTGKCNMNQYDKHSIGFKVNTGFIGLMEVCYDPQRHTTLYIKFIIVQGVENRQRNVPRQNYFRKGGFFKGLKPPIESVYNCKSGQYSIFANLLGSEEAAQRYIDCNSRGGESLEKGHLAAYADFVYYPQQKATLHYINTVPQWQSFNAGNWKILEEKIRIYAKVHNTSLFVYAGFHKVARLRDKNNKELPIFLTKDLNNNDAIPVPEQMYRIVYDQDMRRSIVFLGINNVEINPNISKRMICQDVCEQSMSFFTGWNRTNASKGYIYCCTLNDFLTSSGLKSAFPVKNVPLLN